MLTEFREFMTRGNVFDLAVGIVIGVAFGAVVTSFVAAFLTPLIGLATGATGDFRGRVFTVGTTQFPYGEFLQALISFVLIAAAVYFVVVRPVNRVMALRRTEPDVTSLTKSCPECLSAIPVAAIRCAFCTVEQDPLPATG